MTLVTPGETLPCERSLRSSKMAFKSSQSLQTRSPAAPDERLANRRLQVQRGAEKMLKIPAAIAASSYYQRRCHSGAVFKCLQDLAEGQTMKIGDSLWPFGK